MGFSNPPISWSEFERRLSGGMRPGKKGGPGAGPRDRDPVEQGEPGGTDADGPGIEPGDGGDSPAWSRKRHAYAPVVPPVPPEEPAAPTVPYAELHAHSAFSFLDGASHPERLVEEAVRLGLTALALTDHDGFYGAARFAEAAEAYPQLATVYGAELSLELDAPQNGAPDPAGSHLLLLARGQTGYHRLAAAITEGQLATDAEKGAPRYDLDDLASRAGDDWLVLTGCRKASVRRALRERGADAAGLALRRLVDRFGSGNVVVELFDHGDPDATAQNDALAELATQYALPLVATGNVHYARPDGHRIAQALAAVRARRSLEELDGWLPASGQAYLRSGAEVTERFGRYPGAIANTVRFAEETAFPLKAATPGLPKLPVPDGLTPMSWLRELTWEGAERTYGAALDDVKRERIERELTVIEQKDFPGYFLIVRDIVAFAKGQGILCQGRGSAANSAVCYLIGITAVDAIYYGLPFERFLNSIRDEEPDIDVDFDSDRREEVIQYVYDTYGRRNAAQVANVISYRPKGAVRDMAKALGYSPGQQDAWSKQVERWGSTTESTDHDIPDSVVSLASDVLTYPRHLGIHSGGMVLTDRPVGEVVPIENARMDKRTVLQWDKDDCAYMGLVKFDLLGLGMLAALQYTIDLVDENLGERWELREIPKEEPAVYDALCRADTVGVFQVESRAQMGMLPRLQPRQFYDLVVEVALVRPGPIQGGAVHPYITQRVARREWNAKRDRGEVTGTYPIPYLHPKLEPVLERTLGIPIFQEQLMQMAVAVGNCTGEDADLLRRAMGSKRGQEKISSLRGKLYEGMAENGITGEDADVVYSKIEAFANFGFAESHSISFALLVYDSAWFRLHYPAAFLAALLRAQPMGFYSPQSLVADARRHGVEVRGVDIQLSRADASLEPLAASAREVPKNVHDGPRGERFSAPRETAHPSFVAPRGRDACLGVQPPVGVFDPTAPDDSDAHRRDGDFAVRMGLADVRGLGAKQAERIVAEREESGPFVDLFDLARRTGLTAPQLEALASGGAFASFGLERREAIWQAGQAARERPDQLAGTAIVVQPPLFAMLSPEEQVATDLWATGVSPDGHPVEHIRAALDARDILSAEALRGAENGRRIRVAGVVTHRQRPATASGITFLNIEDETGLVNVICSVGVWTRYRRIVREKPALVVRGILERSPEGIVNIVADGFEPLVLRAPTRSRDFQ